MMAFSAPGTLIFTDLDGTLLDADYRCDAAATALELIRQQQIPLILTSSKTLAELQVLQRNLGINGPLIFENGAGLALPDPATPTAQADLNVRRFRVQHGGPGYPVLRKMLVNLRQEWGFTFRGFGDMELAEVVAATGLDEIAAQRARQRTATEPLQWQDSNAALQRFRELLQQRGLQLVEGGRFLHVMPGVDKGEAMQRVVRWYQTLMPTASFRVLAAGDSANDRAMLERADIAIVVRRTDGTWLALARTRGVVRTTDPGPAGWQASLLPILTRPQEVSNE